MTGPAPTDGAAASPPSTGTAMAVIPGGGGTALVATDGAATTLIRSGTPQPANRFLLSEALWSHLPAALAAEPGLDLLALWAEPGLVHAAFLDIRGGAVLLASGAAPQGRFAALSPARPAAIRFERTIADLWGLEAEGAPDLRPWLDHGRWLVAMPLSDRAARHAGEPPQPVFLAAEGEGVHQIPLGPIQAGITEPGHFRFHVQGETIVRLETLLGYTHKGILGLMQGKSPRLAARLAARLSGDSTVAHGWAFARAAEAATGTTPPPRALALRGVMAELERIANHLNDWGALCNDVGFAWPHARCGSLREAVLRVSDTAFGHRLLMDRVIPGGVAADIAPGGAEAILEALSTIAAEMPGLVALCDDHASLQDRLVGTGILRPDLALRFAAGGPVGRASGRDFDARRDLPYAPYDSLDFTVPVLAGGDVEARLRIRILELEQSIALVAQLLARLEPGETLVPLPQRAGEGVGVTEAFRGEALWWVSLDATGLIRGVFPRDASWLQWPLLEAAVAGNIVADFPLCNTSFNCSHSGVDL